MSRVCRFTGRKTSSGFSYRHRGKAKYLGGVGTKVTARTKRNFRPNIHTVTAVVEGSVQRIKISTKAIRTGLLVKPLKRKFAYKPTPGNTPGIAPAETAQPPPPPPPPEVPAVLAIPAVFPFPQNFSTPGRKPPGKLVSVALIPPVATRPLADQPLPPLFLPFARPCCPA
ncbi:MAG: 50S ribosomal protein L28 [Phycisphaeraceae bacterium]|nr:50S ribosomal protein L28 [Phycisphaeraceae bacterium]